MAERATGTEYLLARKMAEEYRSRGYEVAVETPLDFMPGFRADLIVRKGDEAKVIEIKSRSSLGAIPQIGELARIIDAKPGWSFELLLVGDHDNRDSPKGARTCDRVRVRERIREADKALEVGLCEAAFLLAWSAVEAAALESMAQEGVPVAAVTTRGDILDQALFHGVLSRSDYNDLSALRANRNAIAHGFTVDGLDDEAAAGLITFARRIAEAGDAARSA